MRPVAYYTKVLQEYTSISRASTYAGKQRVQAAGRGVKLTWHDHLAYFDRGLRVAMGDIK